MSHIQTLRTLSVELNTYGDAEQVNKPFKLYKGSYGFVNLQCYVPKTQNTTETAICSVYRTFIDDKGNRVNGRKYNMPYVGEAERDGFAFLLFECPFPREFTATEGELDLIFNYADTDGNNTASDILTSKILKLYVSAGGWNDEAIILPDEDITAAKVNELEARTANVPYLVKSIQKVAGNAITYTNNSGDESAPIIIGGGEDVPIPTNAASVIKIQDTEWNAVYDTDETTIKAYTHTIDAAIHGQMNKVQWPDVTANDLWVSFDKAASDGTEDYYGDYHVSTTGDITITVDADGRTDLTVRVWNGKGLVDTKAREDIEKETKRAEAAEQGLQDNINAETTRATAKEENLQSEIGVLQNQRADYVLKEDNEVPVVTTDTFTVTETGELSQTVKYRDIRNGTVSERQTAVVPVTNDKARLFLVQEQETLRDLVSWRDSLYGNSLNFEVDLSDLPTGDDDSAAVQAYLTEKYETAAKTEDEPLDQTTLTDESIPLSFRYYLSSKMWYKITQGQAIATNNQYNADGELETPGAAGVVVGSNLKYHAFVEPNGEMAINGLDALDEKVVNNTNDITTLKTQVANNTEDIATQDATISETQTALAQKVDKSGDTIMGDLNVLGQLKEQGQRVYSPNNRDDSKADIYIEDLGVAAVNFSVGQDLSGKTLYHPDYNSVPSVSTLVTFLTTDGGYSIVVNTSNTVQILSHHGATIYATLCNNGTWIDNINSYVLPDDMGTVTNYSIAPWAGPPVHYWLQVMMPQELRVDCEYNYKNKMSNIYDVIIKSQEEFETWLSNTSGRTTQSVLLVGKGSPYIANNIRIQCPRVFVGINNAEIEFQNMVFGGAYLLYGTIGQTQGNQYTESISGIHLILDTTTVSYNGPPVSIYGFAFLSNLSRCSFACKNNLAEQVTSTLYGFAYCDRVTDCKSNAYSGSSGSTGIGYYNCSTMYGCYGLGSGMQAGTGFSNCRILYGCDGVGSSLNNAYGFFSCQKLTDCRGSAQGAGPRFGFYSCSQLSGTEGYQSSAASVSSYQACTRMDFSCGGATVLYEHNLKFATSSTTSLYIFATARVLKSTVSSSPEEAITSVSQLSNLGYTSPVMFLPATGIVRPTTASTATYPLIGIYCTSGSLGAVYINGSSITNTSPFSAAITDFVRAI